MPLIMCCWCLPEGHAWQEGLSAANIMLVVLVTVVTVVVLVAVLLLVLVIVVVPVVVVRVVVAAVGSSCVASLVASTCVLMVVVLVVEVDVRVVVKVVVVVLRLVVLVVWVLVVTRGQIWLRSMLEPSKAWARTSCTCMAFNSFRNSFGGSRRPEMTPGFASLRIGTLPFTQHWLGQLPGSPASLTHVQAWHSVNSLHLAQHISGLGMWSMANPQALLET
mmetsp:Transcript_115727/g.373931  ORF Transcript_115727/g.373931 Transcript_115727/m.373931 type:complete len:220 (-) Transcript_115727:842-1501(-)